MTDSGRRSADGRAALLNLVYVDEPFAADALDRTQVVRDVVAEETGSASSWAAARPSGWTSATPRGAT